MAVINPFELNPAGPDFQFMLNYWFATWSRLIYEEDLTRTVDLMALVDAGEDDLEVFDEDQDFIGDNVPRVEIIHAPAGDLVQVRGTSTNTQLAIQFVNAQADTYAEWPGAVNSYFATRALQVWDKIADSINAPWLSVGHSLGGAIAGLIAWFGAEKTWTNGQPREGNPVHAAARDDSKKLRLVNHEDIGPRIPPGGGFNQTQWTRYVIPPRVNPVPDADYKHWGHQWYASDSGILSLSTLDLGSSFDLGFFLGQSQLNPPDWVLTHYSPVYCRRIRFQIPYPFPWTLASPDFPGLAELDAINLTRNGLEGIEWEYDGGEGYATTDAGDVQFSEVGEWAEIGDYLERSTYPFRCPGDVDQVERPTQ